MCFPLFKKELRSGWKTALIFISMLAMYTCVVIAMFDPALGESLAMMAESMPELFALFNMNGASSTLLEFLSTYLYGFLYILLPLVWIIMLVNKLMIRYVDRGVMAGLLAAPVSRRRLAVNQCAVLLLWLVITMISIVGLELATSGAMFPGELNISGLFRLNFGLFGILLLLSSICWLGGCVFNDSGPALGSGGGLCALFVLLQMLGNAGEKAKFCLYLTPITLFDTTGLIAGDAASMWQAGALYAGAGLLFALGIVIFTRKDLSI